MAPPIKPMEFSREERADIVNKIQRHFHSELEQEIGNIAAEQLLVFFTKEIGAYYYNRGLNDAQAVFTNKLDEINDAIYGLEQREARVR
jgi:uncharacterized protein (DUF2164 family)